ncbi:MAG: gluconeogenesis factor YvcK family protein [Christensenellales bacterium]|jgi:uncharacterized cofD-like protein
MSVPHIAALGGGSGLSALLRSLKRLPCEITAIVTVADDGGNSGRLRRDQGSLPPGDIRNCLIALSHAEPDMERLLQFRFKEGELAGQCMGNLLLVALDQLHGGFIPGIQKISKVLAVAGQVLPVTLENVRLRGWLENGQELLGESILGNAQRTHGAGIRRLALEPEDCAPLPQALDAIRAADLILIGPGSLYTSLIAVLLVPGVTEAIRENDAPCYFVGNIMTQPGETQGYSMEDHTDALSGHLGDGLLDGIIVNSGPIPPEILERYLLDGCGPVPWTADGLQARGLRICAAPLAEINDSRVRHDPEALSAVIRHLL